MKLSVCSPQLGIDPNSNLGGEIHDFNLLKQLAQKGVKVHTYLPKHKAYEKHANIAVERSLLNSFPAIIFNILEIPYLFRTYKKRKFNILRVHSPYFSGVGALFFKLLHPNVPVVATYHLREEGVLFDLINRLTIKKYDAIICVSSDIKKWVCQKYKLKPSKVHIIYNGASGIRHQRAKDIQLAKKYRLENKTVIMFMGLLTERKNPMLLLKAYREIKKKKKNTALVFCGDGPLKNKLKNFVKKIRLNDVFFPGIVKSKEKIDYYNLCDIFALPSKREGMPLAILDAMNFAKPVIMQALPYSKSIVEDGVDGILVPKESIKSWADAISKLIERPTVRKKIGLMGRKKILKGFSWEKAAQEHIRVFKSFTNT